MLSTQRFFINKMFLRFAEALKLNQDRRGFYSDKLWTIRIIIMLNQISSDHPDLSKVDLI